MDNNIKISTRTFNALLDGFRTRKIEEKNLNLVYIKAMGRDSIRNLPKIGKKGLEEIDHLLKEAGLNGWTEKTSLNGLCEIAINEEPNEQK